MRTTFVSVFRSAYPSPGKCFIEARAPRSPSPSANAFASRDVVAALNDQVLPWRYMNDDFVAGTSATGAKSVLTPRSRSAAPVRRPWRRALYLESSSPSRDGEIVGGIQEIVFTGPPSWSTAMR